MNKTTLLILLFLSFSNGAFSTDENPISLNSTQAISIPKLKYYSSRLFFQKETNSLVKKKRILLRLHSINKNLKEMAKIEALSQDDPYLNPERFTKSKLWRFFNYARLRVEKKKKPRHPSKVIRSFSFEKYLILDKNPKFSNVSGINVKLALNKTNQINLNQTELETDVKSNKYSLLEDLSTYSGAVTPGDFSGALNILEPRRPKNLILVILGVGSDELYYEAFRHTHYPFISQIKMFGKKFEMDTGIIFPHPYLRKFKLIGPIGWSYRFAWADFAFGFRPKRINTKQWMYSVESILMLINFLVEVEKYDPKRIFIYGYSQGGAMALSVTLRSKYVLGGMISTASYLAERIMKELFSMEPKITEEGLKIPMLLSHCNPDLFFPFRSSRKDVRYLREVLKANVKYSLMLSEGHSCLTKYSMVYIDWIYHLLSNTKSNEYKPKDFSYKLLDVSADFDEYYNKGLSFNKRLEDKDMD
ncbi:Phospholipase/Carboxylesterase family protein [Cryptosporidium felis]|nr:Phospholipase/Carboxylesterase family protein [Cryptosporidium felis]